MEAHIPNHHRQCEDWTPGAGPSSVRVNSELVVEISHRHATNLRSRSEGIKQAKKAIGDATLGRIQLVGSREESNRLQGNNISTFGELSYNEIVSNFQISQEMRSPGLLQRGSSGDIELLNNVETIVGSIQGPTPEDGMEHDNNINNED